MCNINIGHNEYNQRKFKPEIAETVILALKHQITKQNVFFFTKLNLQTFSFFSLTTLSVFNNCTNEAN